MSNNERRTHSSAIEDDQNYVRSKRFRTADSVELEYRKTRLEKNFVLFSEKHHDILKQVSEEDFAWENEWYRKTDEIYTELIIEFNRRIKTVEAEELAVRLEKKPGAIDRMKIPMPILEFGPANGRNRILFLDGSERFLPLNKRAFIEISTDDEEDEEVNDNKSDSTEKHTIPSKVVKIDLRDKIEEKAVRLNEISKEMKQKKNEIKRREEAAGVSEKKQIICNNCGGDHQMYKCPAFLRLTRAERWERVKAVHTCPNCFMTIFERKHFCRVGPCYCGRRHNSLLCDN